MHIFFQFDTNKVCTLILVDMFLCLFYSVGFLFITLIAVFFFFFWLPLKEISLTKPSMWGHADH